MCTSRRVEEFTESVTNITTPRGSRYIETHRECYCAHNELVMNVMNIRYSLANAYNSAPGKS